MDERQVLKNKLNDAYRNYMVLEYYVLGHLKSSFPTDEHKEAVEKAKNSLLERASTVFQRFSEITNRTYNVENVLGVLETLKVLVDSEFFFDLKELLTNFIQEVNLCFSETVKEYRINPLDCLKLYQLKFA